VVLSTAFSAEVDAGADIAAHPAVREAFERAGGAERALVARSSSVVEDLASSSMAGQFASVIGILGFDEFVAAVRSVLDSRRAAGASGSPMAVLVQPLLEPVVGGVLFGVEPVSGRTDRRLVTAVAGGPEPLVSGEVDGSRYLLDPAGRVVERAAGDGPDLPAGVLEQLVGLAARAAGVFCGPQDVEWALDGNGRLWLLQSRPVTTEIRGVPSGPVFGPGPVAETFPEPLSCLEADLWVEPLRDAVRAALVLAGAATVAETHASPVVVTVDGYVAIDLELTGEMVRPSSWWRKLNPRPGARRLQGAWRVGRLRGALPGLADDLLDRVDADLETVPDLAALSSRRLLALLGRSREALRSLHAHEVLMGLLVDAGEHRMTGASVALRVLVESRRDGTGDDEILRSSPVVLALVGPRVAPSTQLPPDTASLDVPGTACDMAASSNAGILREALRLRVRWVQELTGRAAWTLGLRLAAAGEIDEPGQVRHLRIDDLEAIVAHRGCALRPVLVVRALRPVRPLPACFQISDLGRPVPACRGGAVGGGTGAGGGVGTGPVTFDAEDPPSGSVLVTTTLRPGLGPLLPRLAGVVAETGSVLAHLAILAREFGVPTVVGYAGATGRFREGQRITVNGDNGDIAIAEESP
jgi:pyruvate,water dikinase